MRPRERALGLGHLPWQCSESVPRFAVRRSPSALRPAATVDRLGRPCHLQPTGRRWARQNNIKYTVRYLVSSPCVVTMGGLETKRPVSELYGRSGGPAAPRVTITSSPASAGLFFVRFRTILVWNRLPLAFVIYRTNGAMGCDDQESKSIAPRHESAKNSPNRRAISLSRNKSSKLRRSGARWPNTKTIGKARRLPATSQSRKS